MKLFSFYIAFLLIISCNTGNSAMNQQQLDQKEITDLEHEIMALVNSSVCTNETECAFIAFGSKACGGPNSYLVYSNSIDTDLLIRKVTLYNQMQHDYNIEYGIISTCDVPPQPTSVICENNKCKALYN